MTVLFSFVFVGTRLLDTVQDRNELEEVRRVPVSERTLRARFKEPD